MEKESLIQKYNVAGPRYTSYPTVPFWDAGTFSPLKWKSAISEKFSANREEISLYIHLPFCESLCTFCGCNTRITVNHKVETPYIETVLREWDLYLAIMDVRPVIKEIHLGGGTPTFFSPENLKKLINGITSRVKVAHHPEFGFEGHPNNTTKEHLQTLYDLGFRRVSFGIQDFDPIVQTVINRKQTFEQVKEVTENARAIGYSSINFDIVYGLPLQTLDSVINTINKVNELKPDRIAYYSYAHVPWIKPGQRKFTELDLPEDAVKRSLYETGKRMLEEYGYIEIGMDHFALKSDSLYQAAKNKTLHRNFMGYTTSITSACIGLGVSSISDLWGAFAQNVKTVEEYKANVQEGIIPVFRGHFLNNEDLVIRQHILNIMCKFETSWIDADMQTPSLFRGIDNLYELENDGLVEIGLNDLKITEKGQPFVRNVCMALDARMHEANHQNILFSKVI
jgi:oxygen-independent coproporphyrinogen-3 oxidase